MQKVSPFRALITALLFGAIFFGAGFAFTRVTKYRALSAAEASFAAASQTPKAVYLTTSADSLPYLRTTVEREGGVVFTDADLVLLLDESVPIDVLIFEGKLRDEIDRTWLKQRYLHGLILVALNMPISELALLVGDTTAISGPWKDVGPLHDGPYFSMLYFSISGADQADIDRYLNEALLYQDPEGGGSIVPGIGSELNVSRGKAQSYLMDEQSAAILWTNLQNAVASIKAHQ